jgi:transposase
MGYRRYSLQFKDEACRLAAGKDGTVNGVSKELGVPKMTLRSWMKQRKLLPESTRGSQADDSSSFSIESDDIDIVKAKLREAERRIRQLEMERDILKKATAYFAKEQL